VFGSDDERLAGLPTEARTPAQVRENWDAIKKSEPGRADGSHGPIPENLPALLYARKLLKRSRRRDPGSESEHGSDSAYERIGDELLALVERSIELEVDPEIALRHSADRFRERANADG
jgi:XTP/dITP diphosphohydrolase/tetrapyrrole methylase family protein/MazG family protein/ATP diphosphatase